MLAPVNDLCKIELARDEYDLGTQDKGTAESGILVELPDELDYLGFWSFAFENSFMNKEQLAHIYKRFERLIGKRVYWTALAEKGNIIQDQDGGRFAFVKLTSLIASDDKDSKAFNIHSDGSGAFTV